MSFMPGPGQWVTLTDGRPARVTHVTPDGSDDRVVFPDGHEEHVTAWQILKEGDMTKCAICGHEQDASLMIRTDDGLVCKDSRSCTLRWDAARKQSPTDLTAGVIPDLTDEEIDGFVDGTAGDSPATRKQPGDMGVLAESIQQMRRGEKVPAFTTDEEAMAFIRAKEESYRKHVATGCDCMTLAEYLGMTPQELAAWRDRGEVSDRVRRSWGLPSTSPGSEKAAGADTESAWEEAAACPQCGVEAAPRGWRAFLVPVGRALAWFSFYGDTLLDHIPGFNAEFERLYSKWAERENAAANQRAPEAEQ